MSEMTVQNVFGRPNTAVIALSAGIIAPEHDLSALADINASLPLSGRMMPEDEWTERYNAANNDWIKMHITWAAEQGVEVTREEVSSAYGVQFGMLYLKQGKPTLPGAKDLLDYCSREEIPFGLATGQWSNIVNGLYVPDAGLILRPELVKGGLIPATPDIIDGAVEDILSVMRDGGASVNYLVLVDGNKSRLKAAGDTTFASRAGLESVVKIGVKDKWLSKGLSEVTDYQFKSVVELYGALTGGQ